jgi:hypothetical protein
MTEEHKNSIGYSQAAKKEERIFNAEMTKSLRTMTETIEQAAERYYQEHIDQSNIPREHYEREIQYLMVCFADYWQSSQPNQHRIVGWHVVKLIRMYEKGTVKLSRMVEILNEIAAGKHKERIEI